MKAVYTAMPKSHETEFPVEALPDPRRPDRANPPANFWWSLFWQQCHDLHALGLHWTDNQQGILCWEFKGVQEEIPSKEASTLQIGSVAFTPGQCASPQLHSCHRLFDQEGHQDSSSASLQSRLCSLWHLVIPLSSEAVVMRELRRWKRLWQGHWHDHTRGLPWGLPEVVGTVQVHCSRRRLLRGELEFHVCTINKSAHTKKAWKLS